MPFTRISLGWRTVILFDEHEIDEAQVGYRRTSSGRNLTSSTPGSWQPTWLVIGIDDELGDPLFIDLADVRLPVYTCAHGAGSWEPVQIADSFEAFVRAAQRIAVLSHGRESPRALDDNPLDPADVERVLSDIACENRASSLEFWESWLEGG